METEKKYGTWQGRKVLFIGDSLTARRVYPEVVKEILGIETFYHCKGGVGVQHMVDGDKGLGGEYDNETDAQGVLRPLLPEDVQDMDLIVLFGGYNNRSREIGKPVSNERIRYQRGESYYQLRDGKVVLEKYDANPPYPYIGDQVHKSPAGYRRIGEVIAGAIIAAYGN